MRRSRLSCSKIIRVIRKEFGERLGKSQVSYWTRAPKGDGNKRFKHDSNYYDIEIKRKPELIELFAEAVPKFADRPPLPMRPAEWGKVRASFESVGLYCLFTDFKALRRVAAFCRAFSMLKEASIDGRSRYTTATSCCYSISRSS